tara:strand:- start:220 stop:450 length:231 start_codon:yes stop_codon:yes gene_type:complete
MLTKLEKAMILENKRSKKEEGFASKRKKMDNLILGKSNNETFTWSQINTALMNTGVKPWRIADILSNLNKAKKETI